MKFALLVMLLLLVPLSSAVIDQEIIDDGVIIIDYPEYATIGEYYTVSIRVNLESNSITALELKTPESVTFDCAEQSCEAYYGFEMSTETIPFWFTLELSEPRNTVDEVISENTDFFFFQSPVGQQTLYNKKVTIIPDIEEIEEAIKSNPQIETEFRYLINEVAKIDITKEEFDRQKALAEKNFEIKKVAKLVNKVTESGRLLRTEWIIKVIPKNDVKKAVNLYVIEEVPKEGAPTFNEIVNSNYRFSVLKEDPIIMWHFASVDKDTQIEYETSKASITGAATVVLVEDVDKGAPWQVIVPIIIIPLIAGLILYFSRFKKA